MGIIKYVKLFLGFRDIQKAWKEEKGVDRPKWLSRGVLGAVLVFLGLLLSVAFGVNLDQTVINQLKDNLEKLVEGLWALKPVVIALYGIIMVIAKIIKEAKKKTPETK